MSTHDKIDEDGISSDTVHDDSAASQLHVYSDDRQQLAAFQAPVLLHADNPHERLYVAALDGTGNDKINDPDHETNVGLIADQIDVLNRSGNNKIGYGYVAGPGTQQHDPIARTLDGATGYTADARVEEMYKKFIEQAKTWQQEDPNVQIRVAATGFSRGGDEVALLTRLIEKRGIQDRDGAKYTYDSHHQITHVEYTKPPLVPPHQVAQTVVLFDPVGTGHEMHLDRRLPPSVISGIQFTAMDEHRGLFKSDRIIDPGITPDGRFAGVYVPGAHSDDGGSYHRNGLSIRTGNMAIDYFNRLSDQPILAKQAEPDDPRLNVIHHSQEGNLLYQLAPKIDRLQPGGYNELLVPKSQLGHVADPYNAEPRNDALSRQFEWQRAYAELPQVAPQATQPGPAAAPTQQLDPAATLANLAGATATTTSAAPLLMEQVDTPQGDMQTHLNTMVEAARTGDWTTVQQGAHALTQLNDMGSDHALAPRAAAVTAPPLTASRGDAPSWSSTPSRSLDAHKTPGPVGTHAHSAASQAAAQQPDHAAVNPTSMHEPSVAITSQASLQVETPPPVETQSANMREMFARFDRYDQAMEAGDRARAMKEIAHIYETPEWKADYARAHETVAKEYQQKELERAQNPRDPRDAGHPDHAMNQSIRKQVEDLHCRAGIYVSNKELDHLTAGVAKDARDQGMTRVDHVQFGNDQASVMAMQQNSQNDIFSKRSATNVEQAMQTPPEHAYQHMGQETQRQADVQQALQLQAAQVQQQGPSLGR